MTKEELFRSAIRHANTAQHLLIAFHSIDAAVTESLTTGFNDRVRSVLDQVYGLGTEMADEGVRLMRQSESMPDEDDAGDALEAAERPARFETV